MDTSIRTQATDVELIQCCASRIISLTTEIERAWEMGVPHGEHREPWTFGFQRIAAKIYLETVPAKYALNVAQTYMQCAHLIVASHPPTGPSENGQIVVSYFRAVSESMDRTLATGTDELENRGQALRPTVPGVVRFDKIAKLVHPEGIARLRRAAELERNRRGVQLPILATDIELIRMVADGLTVADIAVHADCSRRTLYRRFEQTWAQLGVRNAKEAILLGGRDGWL